MRRTIVLLASVLVVAACAEACGLVVSFDYDTNAPTPPAPPSHRVGGVVDGLGGATVSLALNGADRDETGDGPFTFPVALPEGAAYGVTVVADPAGHTCAVTNGTGTIGKADVTSVLVHCPSDDATLTSLTTSLATLTPAFAPAVLAYDAGRIRVSVVLPPPTTMTVTATARNPAAAITVDATPAMSGVASAPITLGQGSTSIDVAVTAPDKTSTTHYAIAVAGYPNDYLKSTFTQQGGRFGHAIASSGDTLAIGAPGEAASGSVGDSSGSTYVFTRGPAGWMPGVRVRPTPASAGNFFGRAVALDADTLVVGAPTETVNTLPGAGAVYVFERSSSTAAFVQTARLTANTPLATAAFGTGVGVSGGVVAVGAPQDGNGTVYVFTKTSGTWSSATSLTAAGTAMLGSAVAIDVDTIAAGAPNDGSEAGAVYVFRRSGTTWGQEAALRSSPTAANAAFGSFVSVSADTIAVGAPSENQGPSQAGAAYVFTRSGTTWTQQAQLKASNPEASAYFGSAVSVAGDSLAVGAYGENGSAVGVNGVVDPSAAVSGAVYVFFRAAGAWTQSSYVKSSNTRAGMTFGSSVSLTSKWLAAGAPFESSAATGVNGDQGDHSELQAGAAYVF